jgi:rhodanese-related sulfurtransferase
MKKIPLFSKIIILVFCFSLTNCDDSNGQQKTSQSVQQAPQTLLNPDDFEAKALQTGVQLVDVRTPAEYQAGHIANAANINFNDPEFKANIEKLDKTKPIAVYCAAGGRSGKSANLLAQMGFKTIYDLQGGMGAWKAKGKKINQ